MKLNRFIEIMERIAPPHLKEDFDNVGLMVGDREVEVKKVLLALDCTDAVIDEAKEHGAELILTHHPLIFKKPSSITTDTLQGKKIIKLIKNDLNLYSAHTNWDSVREGINDTIVDMLGFKAEEIIDRHHADNNAGIGRVVTLEEILTLEEIIERCIKAFGLEGLRYSGELDKKIEKIAIVNGSGQSYFEDAIQRGADLIITGDTTYHFVSDYTEMGMSVLDIGHFKSEWPVLIEVNKKLQKELKEMGEELEFIISEKAHDPFKFKIN
ncbi:MAG: Nif3-like dinuclear metal center hexameric protein [Sarcina sp.]